MTCIVKTATPPLKTGTGNLADQMILGYPASLTKGLFSLFPFTRRPMRPSFGAKLREVVVKEADTDLSFGIHGN